MDAVARQVLSTLRPTLERICIASEASTTNFHLVASRLKAVEAQLAEVSRQVGESAMIGERLKAVVAKGKAVQGLDEDLLRLEKVRQKAVSELEDLRWKMETLTRAAEAIDVARQSGDAARALLQRVFQSDFWEYGDPEKVLSADPSIG